MRTRKPISKIKPLVMCLCFILSILPTCAFAAGIEEEDTGTGPDNAYTLPGAAEARHFRTVSAPVPLSDTGTIYALLYEDGELVFQNTKEQDSMKGEVQKTFTIKDGSFDFGARPMKTNAADVISVSFRDDVAPVRLSFKGCTNLVSFDSTNLDTSNITDMNSMFFDCGSLKSIDVSQWDVSSVTNMAYLFYKCSKLTSLNVSSWKTGNVTDMKYVFYKCSKLESLDVSSWDTHAVTDISYMFSRCNGLSTLDVSKWDTSSVTDMTDLFDSDYRLTALDLTNWKTGNVVSMHHMFYKCSALTELDIDQWDTHSLTNTFDMFGSCRGLTSLDLSGWDTSNVERIESMFTGCTNLENLDLTGWKFSTLASSSSSTSQSNVFNDCAALDELILGDVMYDVSDATKFTVSEDGTVTVSSVEGVVTKDGITFDAAEDGTFDFSASEDALTATGSCTVTTPANNTYTCPESASVTKSEGGSVTVTGVSGITEDRLTVAPIEDGTLTVTEDIGTGIRTVVGAGSVKTANDAEFTPAENSSVVLTKNESGTTTMTGNGTLRTKDGDSFTGNNLVVTENAGDNALSVSGFDVTTTVGGMTITPGEDMVCTEADDGSMTVTGSGTIASSDGVTYQSNAKSKFTITEPSETGEVRVNGSVTVEAGSVDAAFESGSTLTFKARETETTVTGSAGASVTLNADGTVTAKEGTTVTGTAEAGYIASLTPISPTLPFPPSFYPSYYSVAVPSVFEGGSVTVTPKNPKPGATVTVTPRPAYGYEMGELTVTDNFGHSVTVTDNGDGTYSFKMPAAGAIANATFRKCPSLQFPDIDRGNWYHTFTDYVISHDLMHGMDTGLFAPDGTVSRAQMVMVLWNMRGKPVVNYYMTYSDVSEGVRYTEAIRWAASEGIAVGYDNGRFGPNDPVTREQMAAMVYRYEQKYGTGGFTGDWMYRLPFTDLDQISDWAFESVAWCNMKGVVTGKDNNIFDPQSPAKRSELASVLTRYCDENDIK